MKRLGKWLLVVAGSWWPFVTKRAAAAMVDAMRERRNREWKELLDNRDRRHWKALDEAAEKADKLIGLMTKLECYRDEHGTYGINLRFDERMMQEMALHGDATLWQYHAERMAHQLERELKTMNFAGFNQHAYEAERKRIRETGYRYPRA